MTTNEHLVLTDDKEPTPPARPPATVGARVDEWNPTGQTHSGIVLEVDAERGEALVQWDSPVDLLLQPRPRWAPLHALRVRLGYELPAHERGRRAEPIRSTDPTLEQRERAARTIRERAAREATAAAACSLLQVRRVELERDWFATVAIGDEAHRYSRADVLTAVHNPDLDAPVRAVWQRLVTSLDQAAQRLDEVTYGGRG
jgi:hypothetical protein